MDIYLHLPGPGRQKAGLLGEQELFLEFSELSRRGFANGTKIQGKQGGELV